MIYKGNYRTIEMLSKEEVLEKMNTIWEFETSRLIHDIPIPVREIATNTKTIYMPEEVMDWDINEYKIIEKITAKLSSNVYIINDKDEVDLVTTEDAFDYLESNIMIIDENFTWIFATTIVFTGIGTALVFGGENFMKEVQEKLSHHKEYISTWL